MTGHAPKTRPEKQLREDALAIWQAGVRAVDSQTLVRQNVEVDGPSLRVGEHWIELSEVRRIVVIGAGKAGAGMVLGLEAALGEEKLQAHDVTGVVNVPDDCVTGTQRVRLHAARPAGLNEPTLAGVQGASEIVRLVEDTHRDDLLLCLISGGGSALLPAPLDGVSLEEKQLITRHLSGAGANISELNTVRKALSKIKGGGLARRCNARRLLTLIISDVLGDPLDVIASGPTVPSSTSAADAVEVMRHFQIDGLTQFDNIMRVLEQAPAVSADSSSDWRLRETIVIGNNAVAVDAAGCEAERRGYSHAMLAATDHEGLAEDLGKHHLRMALKMRSEAGPDCLITGGEPVVQLADESQRGRGGRNQQLILAALQAASEDTQSVSLDRICLLSGGTDGEDGPTDAAGAIISAESLAKTQQLGLAPLQYLRRNDAYNFFEATSDLIKTGPTHTNVCDIRVVVVSQS